MTPRPRPDRGGRAHRRRRGTSRATPRDAVDRDLDPEPQVEPEDSAAWTSRPSHVSVVSEPEPARRSGDEDEFQYHTEAHHAVEGVDRRDPVHRRAQGVRPQPRAARPEPRHPRGQDLDDPRPVGHRQVGLHQAHGRPAVPRQRRHPRARRVGPEHARHRAVRDAQEVRRAVPGRRAVRLDEPLRQRRLPAAPAHRQGRGRDRRDRQPAPQRGRPRRLRRQDAERALRRDAQARRLRARARARPARSSCSTSPTPASTRSARRCCAS